MAYIKIHKATKITLEREHFKKNKEREEFHTITLTITDEHDNHEEITIFSRDKIKIKEGR